MANPLQVRCLTYAFPCTLGSSGGDSYSFSLTLTREVLENADRVVVIYALRPDQEIETSGSPNSLGILRGSVIEEFPPGPSISASRATRNTRFTLAFDTASGYDTNPRNLEALWKPVYKTTLYNVIDGMDSCDVLEEDPIWVFVDKKDAMPLNRTVSMPRGGGKTVFPDLSIVMYIGSTISSHRLSRRRFLPVLVELKKAISRKFTVNGHPDPARHEARNLIFASFRVGQRQIELSAFLHMNKVQDQSAIILLVGVGPWFRYLVASRQDIFSSPMVQFAKLPESVIETLINNELEGMVDARSDEEDDNATHGQDQQDDNAGPGAALNMSYLPGWSDPVMVGTPEATRILNLVRARLHTMMSTGHM